MYDLSTRTPTNQIERLPWVTHEGSLAISNLKPGEMVRIKTRRGPTVYIRNFASESGASVTMRMADICGTYECAPVLSVGMTEDIILGVMVGEITRLSTYNPSMKIS